jgi:hypothetical protein
MTDLAIQNKTTNLHDKSQAHKFHRDSRTKILIINGRKHRLFLYWGWGGVFQSLIWNSEI